MIYASRPFVFYASHYVLMPSLLTVERSVVLVTEIFWNLCSDLFETRPVFCSPATLHHLDYHLSLTTRRTNQQQPILPAWIVERELYLPFHLCALRFGRLPAADEHLEARIRNNRPKEARRLAAAFSHRFALRWNKHVEASVRFC